MANEFEQLTAPTNYDSAETTSYIRKRILHVLSIYPKLSHSMLQVGIGTALSPKMWRPILDDLIEEGAIQEDTIVAVGPTERTQSYTILELVSKK